MSYLFAEVCSGPIRTKFTPPTGSAMPQYKRGFFW